ncbi:putative type I restriction-modification system subunit S [Vibrio diabolicus E0666]|uniref:restriction endonuclease subunit S n=1 Tax=Vibrio diabolicus TaxID=50719 RepID=UPI0002B7083A|nr:restriction endonuclease subunit S [Vibrio diabolicus]EMD79701.1 putative type I restriction-modification system subunit S [Vibrio diabolicus E0666]
MSFDEISLKDAVEFVVDNRGKTVPIEDTGIPLIATNCISNEHLYPEYINVRYVSEEIYHSWFRAHPQPDDIILTNKGSKNGAICLVPEPVTFCIAQDMVALRAKSNVIYPRYLFAALRSKLVQDRIKELNVDSVIPHFKKTDFDKLYFPLPSMDAQKLIGDSYYRFCRKIEVNRKTNQTLEQIAQSIFKSWFVDFDPVKAKMNGEQLEGMDAATASLFPEKLIESELGLIPEGWEVTKLSKVIDLLNGFAFKSSDYVKEGTFVLRTKNFDSSNSVERLGDDVYLPDEFLESHKKYLCEAYDYHVVMVAASIGKTAMIYPHQLPALRNQNMWCFRPKDESLRFYTKYMVDGLVKLNMGLASGSARAFFKKGDFNSYEFALPSSELLTKFNDVVGNLVRQKGSLLNQNVQLAAMRDTLLPKLLSGEIELGQA